MTTCLPIGEHMEVPISDLANNAAVKYLLSNPKSKPRWCLRKAAHDINTCTFLHRTPDKASGYVTIRGEPAPVSVGHLLQNKGLEAALTSSDTFAEWCSVAAPHEVATCRNLHLGVVRDDKTVLVEGEDSPVCVSHLLLNRGVSYLLSTKGAKGVWCNNKIVHDVLGCHYIHRRIDDHPQVVNVDEEKFPIPVKDLVKNKALTFLLENPQYSGRWCSHAVKHDASECGFLHRIHPFIRVDGESIRIGLLAPNRGLKYVLEHPEAQGHWCRGTHDEQHPMDTCTYIHYKNDDRRDRNDVRGGETTKRHRDDDNVEQKPRGEDHRRRDERPPSNRNEGRERSLEYRNESSGRGSYGRRGGGRN
eukprot:GILI01019163.1.p1 GENE.GILI01019163.1~~GILI01019163.1.p1  ORF type:complete len:361 (+),score=44.26 GILI01019163.1:80-1162(+)